MKDGFRTMPGFLRWLTFNDGPHGYALGLWRSPEDVTSFVRGEAHRAMVDEQRQRPFEHSQFAGVWTAHSVGQRTLYCEACHAGTPATAVECAGCGLGLHDPFGSAVQ